MKMEITWRLLAWWAAGTLIGSLVGGALVYWVETALLPMP